MLDQPVSAPVRAALRRLLVCGVLAIGAAEAALADLAVEIEYAVRQSGLEQAQVSVSVRDGATGRLEARIDGDRPMIPASNMKILTTGAALHLLGPEFQFTTRMVLDDDRLIVVGDGDPAFGDPDLLRETIVGGKVGLSVDEFLDLLVAAVQDAGVERLSRCVVDDRIFDREFVHPSWPRDQLNARSFAEVAGLNFHLNQLFVHLRGGEGRPPAIVHRSPDYDWLSIRNEGTGRTAGRGAGDTAWFARAFGTNRLTLFGNVRTGGRRSLVRPVTVHDAPALFARLLAHRLEAAGISVDHHGVVEPDEPGADGTVLSPVVSTPLSTIVQRCNADSQNLYTESLLKRIGHVLTTESGSWSSGAEAVRHVVLERLRDPRMLVGCVIADGSGLSRENRLTTNLLSAWLVDLANDERLGPIFIESMAAAGRSGTLRNRFGGIELHGCDVRAKSGYLRQVSSLSGYVVAPDGRRKVFSVIVNDLSRPGSTGRAKALQEKVASILAESLAGDSPDFGG